VNSTNLKRFIIGLVICSMGAYLTFNMLGSTSWTTYSHGEKFVVEEEFGPVTYDYQTDMEIGLQEATLFSYYEECDEDDRCYDLEIDKKFELLQKPLALDEPGIDCKDTEDSEEEKMCDVDSTGSTTHSIIIAGLGLLGLTLLLACISVVGYMHGKIVTLLSSISGIIVFVAPIAWFVMLPDLNSGLEPSEQKWRLSHAFYLTLLSGPVIFFGGLVFFGMEAFARDKYEDWDDEDYEADEEYSQITSSILRKNSSRPVRQEQVDINWQGVWDDDGYEWIEHPEGSGIWYWRDQDTGQWVRH
jgi:hypothetical protein